MADLQKRGVIELARLQQKGKMVHYQSEGVAAGRAKSKVNQRSLNEELSGDTYKWVFWYDDKADFFYIACTSGIRNVSSVPSRPGHSGFPTGTAH